MTYVTLSSTIGSSDIPVNSMARLTARIIADLDMTLEEFHGNVVVVSIIQKDTIVLCGGHLKETHTKKTLRWDKTDFALVLYSVFKISTCLAFGSSNNFLLN